jgi:hypothetical protein
MRNKEDNLMRYNSKRLVASLLVFTMIFQVLPLTAFASEGTIPPIPGQTQYHAAGGNGDDPYVYNIGGGHDTISNGGNLLFGPGIWKEDLVFAKEDNDLVIKILNGTGGYSGSVTVEDWYLDAGNKLSKIMFEDGTELTTEEIDELATSPAVVILGTTGVNTLRARSANSSRTIVYGLAGNDTIYGSDPRYSYRRPRQRHDPD